jgi:hypothetical protein
MLTCRSRCSEVKVWTRWAYSIFTTGTLCKNQLSRFERILFLEKTKFGLTNSHELTLQLQTESTQMAGAAAARTTRAQGAVQCGGSPACWSS